jgi:nardilysin
LSDPFDTRAFKSILKVFPVEDVHGLTLTWPLAPLEDKYLAKPLSYLGWVIGHEGISALKKTNFIIFLNYSKLFLQGHGSLISYLRKKVMALSLAAGSDDDFSLNSSCSLFTIEIVLSESGRCRVEEVIESVFSYLKMLKGQGPSERIFKEIQKLGELEFEFGEEKQPQEMVKQIIFYFLFLKTVI